MQYHSVVKLRTKDDEIIYAECSYDIGEGVGVDKRIRVTSQTIVTRST